MDNSDLLRRRLWQARPRHLGLGRRAGEIRDVHFLFAFGLHPAPQTLLFALLAGIALSLLLGIPASTIVARESGRHDPQFVVIDEVAGQWIALIGSHADWRHALIALVLFRLFDMTKPLGIRQLEKLPEGWGIVLDDVGAGLYALGVASLLHLWV